MWRILNFNNKNKTFSTFLKIFYIHKNKMSHKKSSLKFNNQLLVKTSIFSNKKKSHSIPRLAKKRTHKTQSTLNTQQNWHKSSKTEQQWKFCAWFLVGHEPFLWKNAKPFLYCFFLNKNCVNKKPKISVEQIDGRFWKEKFRKTYKNAFLEWKRNNKDLNERVL